MARRAQQESGEGRVTAKSRPMMNLTERTPSFVSSSASSNPGRTSYGYQDPERSVLIDDRTEKPVETSRSDYLQKDYGRSWSSQEWKSGAAKHQKYKGRVVLRGDIVKDNSGSYAVFTEPGSSASQMIAAKIMDIISRLPGCDGQAADAVSASTQVNIEDAHKLLKIPKSECPDIWIRLPRHKWPKSWSSMEDPVVPLERNLYGHPLAGLLWERQFEKILLKHGGENIPNWDYSYLCMWMT